MNGEAKTKHSLNWANSRLKHGNSKMYLGNWFYLHDGDSVVMYGSFQDYFKHRNYGMVDVHTKQSNGQFTGNWYLNPEDSSSKIRMKFISHRYDASGMKQGPGSNFRPKQEYLDHVERTKTNKNKGQPLLSQ